MNSAQTVESWIKTLVFLGVMFGIGFGICMGWAVGRIDACVYHPKQQPLTWSVPREN